MNLEVTRSVDEHVYPPDMFHLPEVCEESADGRVVTDIDRRLDHTHFLVDSRELRRYHIKRCGRAVSEDDAPWMGVCMDGRNALL